MSKTAKNIELYFATFLILTIGVVGFWVFAPHDKRGDPYWNRLANGCFMLYGAAILDRPGCFELHKDLVLGRPNDYFLYIKSSNVSVDLKGFTIDGPGRDSISAAILVEAGDNVRIQNGRISQFMYGIRVEPGVAKPSPGAIYIKDIEVIDASVIGIKLQSDQAFLRGISVSRSQNEGEIEKFKYLYDILVSSANCDYKAAKPSTDQVVTKQTPTTALPDSCLAPK